MGSKQSFELRGDQLRSQIKKEKHKGFHDSYNPFEVATSRVYKDMFRPLSPAGFEPSIVGL